jgi:hypothetical protein
MIRARQILESISQLFRLDERNVINTDEIDAILPGCLHNARYPEIKVWFNSTLRKWLINEYDRAEIITSDNQHTLSPTFWKKRPWAQEILDSGEGLYYVSFTPDLLRDLDHLVDYFNYALDRPEELPRDLRMGRDITRVSAPDALEKAEDWTRWLAQKASDEEDSSGIEEIMSDGSYTWVYVTSPQALDREGKLMQHCVGSYADEVAESKCRIISLRDSQNEPHITLEIRDKTVVQIKGKQNQPPVKKYIPLLADFLNYGLDNRLFNDIDENDFDRTGLFHFGPFGGRVYQDATDLPKEFWSEGGLGKLVERGDLETIELLLKQGLDPDTLYKNKRPIGASNIVTPLCHAIAVLNWNLADLLLDYGASPTKPANGDRGSSPLIFALNYNLYDVAERLIKLGAKIEQSSLNLSIWNGTIKKIDLLLEGGADPNGAVSDHITDRNPEEGPPLWICHYRTSQSYSSTQWVTQYKGIAEKLFRLGADPNVDVNYHGDNLPLIVHVANTGAYDIFECFMDNGIKRHSSSGDIYQEIVEAAAVSGREGILKLLLSKARDIDVSKVMNDPDIDSHIASIIYDYARRNKLTH